MNYSEIKIFPSIFKFFNISFPGRKNPIVLVHFFYLLAAFAITYVYYHKIISPVDLYTNDYGGVFKVLNIDAISTIQFRFLVPILVGALTSVIDLPPKAAVYLLTMLFTYLTIIAYYRILCLYFENKLFNSLLALLIIYPLSWNLIAVNNIFFFTDTSSLFFMTFSLYFMLNRNFNLMLVVFFLGVVNHYSIGFIIPAFLLFNYKSLFRFRTISYASALVIIFAVYYLTAKMLLPNLPPGRDDGFLIINLPRTLMLITDTPKHLLIRDIIFNFGGIHIFALLFYFSPMWKKIRRDYTAFNLIILIFIVMTVTGFGLYSEELRCYVPVLPFLMIPSMLFFSQYGSDLMPIQKSMLRSNRKN
jgi:hypothetical protein